MQVVRAGGSGRGLGWDLLLFGWMSGITAGFIHAAVVLFRRGILEQFTWMSRDIVWMSPLGNAVLLTVIALPLAVSQAVRSGPRMGRFAVGILAGIAAVSALLSVRVLATPAVLVLGAGIGVALARLNWRPAGVRRGALGATIALTAVGLVSVLLQREVPSRASYRAGASHVLIIILDTVRAASTSLGGYARKTTPNIDRLASEGVAFDWAISPAPWTLPTHASAFTGRPPGTLSSSWHRSLDGTYPTVAEVFRDSGYATAAFVGNLYYTHHESGIDRGFNLLRDYRRSPMQVLYSTTLVQSRSFKRVMKKPTFRELASAVRHLDLRTPFEPAVDRPAADEVVNGFLEWRRSYPERPTMAFLNLFDAHDPYEPPERVRTRFAARPTEQDLYDAGISYVDEEVGRLVDTMRKEGMLDNTIVVIAGDHGEEWGEHGMHGHGISVYIPSVHVPLVMRFPKRVPAGIRVSRFVSLKDIGATLLDAAGIRDSRIPGSSLLRACCEPGAEYDSPVTSETEQLNPAWPNKSPAYKGPLAAVFLDSLQYIRNGDSTYQLFDVHKDYAQTRNLLVTRTGCAEGMKLDSRLRDLALLPSTPPLTAERCPFSAGAVPATERR
jgi:arylsulfatase A-like enzyme